MAASDQGGHSRIWRETGGAGGATALVVASGGVIRGEAGASLVWNGVVDFTSGQVTFPANLARGYIPLDLGGVKVKTTATASGVIALGSTAGNPALRSQDVTGGPVILRWTTAAGNANPIVFPSVRVPDDLATAGGLRVHVNGEAASANAEKGLAIRFYAGAATASGGFTTVALTSTVGERNATIASGSIPATGFITIGLQPTSAHASGDVDLYNAGLSYAKKTS